MAESRRHLHRMGVWLTLELANRAQGLLGQLASVVLWASTDVVALDSHDIPHGLPTARVVNVRNVTCWLEKKWEIAFVRNISDHADTMSEWWSGRFYYITTQILFGLSSLFVSVFVWLFVFSFVYFYVCQSSLCRNHQDKNIILNTTKTIFGFTHVQWRES